MTSIESTFGKISSCLPNPSPLQNLELLKKDYVSGEVTLSYLRKKGTPGRSELLFCVIELITPWIEEGPEEETSKRLGGNSDYSVHLKRVRLPVLEAMKLYEDFRTQKSLQVPKFSHEGIDRSSWTLEVPTFGEEPAWPHLQCEPISDYFWEESPFWGFRPGGVRRHQLLPISYSHPFNALNFSERKKCREWLLNQLHFDLEFRPVHIGSCHLVLPNPIFSNLVHHFDSADRTKMHFRLAPFPGADLSSLSIIFRERRPGGMGQVHTVRPSNNVFTVCFGYEPYELGWDVICSLRGLLYNLGPSMFIRSVHINMGIVTEVRKIYVPDKELRQTEETYTSNVATSNVPIEVGKQSFPQATIEIIKDIVEYKQKSMYAWQQDWFDDVRKAKEKLRALIRPAKQRIRIVDPYLGLREFQSFALATSNTNVIIEILSSASYLKKKKKNHIKENGEEFFDHLKGLPQSGKFNNVEVRVMPGKKPEIHDRFLIVDNQVWVLGSSLNEFGLRGTVLVLLPYPDVVLFNIEKIWLDNALKLEQFVSERKKT